MTNEEKDKQEDLVKAVLSNWKIVTGFFTSFCIGAYFCISFYVKQTEMDKTVTVMQSELQHIKEKVDFISTIYSLQKKDLRLLSDSTLANK